jgi:uncharacterized Tic20 family protein
MTGFTPLPEGDSGGPARPEQGPSTGGWEWLTAPQPAVRALPLSARPAQAAVPPSRRGQPGRHVAGLATTKLAVPPPAEPAEPAARPSVSVLEPVLDGDEAWAMIAYMGVPFLSLLAPLTAYLARARDSGYVRRHAAQALNLAITVLLYNFCLVVLALILGVVRIGLALEVAGPLALLLWLSALYFLVRGAIRAGLGRFRPMPAWICATLVR